MAKRRRRHHGHKSFRAHLRGMMPTSKKGKYLVAGVVGLAAVGVGYYLYTKSQTAVKTNGAFGLVTSRQLSGPVKVLDGGGSSLTITN